MMARAKRIYILIIKVNDLLSFFFIAVFSKIENMFSVFLSSYRNTRENAKKLRLVFSQHSSLWKREITWGRSRTASASGIILGRQVKTNKEEFSVECHGVDCSGDSKVYTELQIAIRSRLLFQTIKSQEN